MIGIEGEFLFSFSLVDYTNIVFTDDLLSFTVIETCGSPVLPYFELSFTLKNKADLEYFNDSSVISIQLGKNSNDLKDIQFAVKKVLLSPSQESVCTVILRGVYNNQAYLVNTLSEDYNDTSYNVISQIAKRNKFNFKSNVNNTNDSMLWQQASESDFKFLHNVWKHSYINDNACTLIGIDLDNNFIFKNLIPDIASNNIAYTFTTADSPGDEIQVHSDFKTVNNSTVTNAFGGYIREKYVYNVSKREYELIKAPDTIPVISESAYNNTNANLEKNTGFRYLTPFMHENYYKAELININRMLAISSSQIWVTIFTEYNNVHPLDLVMLLAKDGNNQSCMQYSGLYVVTKVVRTVQDRRMVTSVLLSRESFNKMRG